MINKVKKIRGKVVNLMPVPVENRKKWKKTLFGFTTENWKTKLCKIIYT